MKSNYEKLESELRDYCSANKSAYSILDSLAENRKEESHNHVPRIHCGNICLTTEIFSNEERQDLIQLLSNVIKRTHERKEKIKSNLECVNELLEGLL